MELVFHPLSGVHTAVAPVVAALAVENVVLELAAELWAAHPVEHAKAGLDSLTVATAVPAAISKGFSTLTVSCIVDPLPLVGAAVGTDNTTVAHGAAAAPFASVH